MAWWAAIPYIVAAIAGKKSNDNAMANENAMTAASMQPGLTQAPAFTAVNPDPMMGGMQRRGGGLFSRKQGGLSDLGAAYKKKRTDPLMMRRGSG